MTKLCKAMKLSGRRRKASVALRGGGGGQVIVTGITEGKEHVLHMCGKGRIILKWTGTYV
jgi:hypothetical protein